MHTDERPLHGPTSGLNVKASVRELQQAFREAPEPELGALVGLHEAEYAGPAWMRLAGPLAMRLTKMPGWWGKAFRAPMEGADELEGENVLRRGGNLESSIPMRARVAPSRVDGRPALVVSYPPDAPYPWPRVGDELRPVDDRTLLGLTWGIPGGPRDGTPFVLHRREDGVSGYDCDYLVIGSGFGGAVSALRLAEKGHRVIVLEKGRRIGPEEIAASRKSLRKLGWQPELGMHGFFWQRLFRHVGIIGATGVGGGSLVFGGVLIEPKEAFYRDPAWADLGPDWRAELAPHYETAKRMLGRAVNPSLTKMDDHLKATAEAMGVGDSFGPVPLAVFFGPEAETVPDPFFGGEGPERTGCRFCGGCLVGCPYGSKNSLDYNYLYLAERRGAEIRPEQQVTRIEPLSGGGYVVHARHPWRRRRGRSNLRARNVVLAAGVLGTLELLFQSRDLDRTLPNVSRRLGEAVRTNSEAITAILDRDPEADLSRGPAISSDFYPDPVTHITQNRLAENEGLMRFYQGPLVDGERPRVRALKTVGQLLAHPTRTLRVWGARNLTKRLSVLTVMQYLDNELAFRYGRLPTAPWRSGLRSVSVPGKKAPTYLAVANEATRKFAEVSGGEPLNMLIETVGSKSITAHILGGAVMGTSAEQGVIDPRHEVFGHPGLYVVDASAISANLGVNPSLTITALAERFASLIPPAEGAGHPASAPASARAADGAGAAAAPAS
jgi:cholesterol oxidase